MKRLLGGRTFKWLSDETGISQSVLSDYMKGKTPGSDKALAIAKALDADLAWLIGGNAAAPAPGRLLERHPAWSPHSNLQKERDPDLVELDQVDLRYGMGATYLDGPILAEKRAFSRSLLRNLTHSPPEQLFWAIGDGDSMEPTIRSGELILIDRSQLSPRSGDGIWAFAWGDIGMIKRLRPLPDGTVEIHSDNDRIRPALASDGDIHVIGRVVAVVRRL